MYLGELSDSLPEHREPLQLEKIKVGEELLDT